MLPLFIAFIAIVGLYINATFSYADTPHATNGVLDLGSWNQKGVFQIAGQWEFYWDRLLTGEQVQSGTEAFEIVEGNEWNEYETESGRLPGQGRATYRVHVTGAEAGAEYGIRIQNMASAYRLYADDKLLAQNGSFGDKADVPASTYRPQFASFAPDANSFDLILQISNNAYAVGGMWEPVIFGTYGQVAVFDHTLSGINSASFTVIIVVCLFFLMIYIAQRHERDVLILAGIGAAVLLRLSMYGDNVLTYLLPNMPIGAFGWIDYLTVIWVQFLLMYYVYCNYGALMRKWQIVAMLAYSISFSIWVLLMPFDAITGTYFIQDLTFVFVISFVTVQLARAAWQGQSEAALLLGVLFFILLLIFYEMLISNHSIGFYLLASPSFVLMILFFFQSIIVTRRYRRAQQLEISFLKGQIRPHFIHNSLTCIISVARTDPNRTRELLLSTSSYLRSFYDNATDDLIPLRQELEFVRAYVNLEQLRFGDRLQMDYQIEADNILLPPLILQPLVENAFIHGLREKEGGGTVTIYAKRMKNVKARIGVKDDGLGFCAKPSKFSRHGVGIENINSRLSRLYRTQLVFTVPEGGGCEVYMDIPWKETNIDENIPN